MKQVTIIGGGLAGLTLGILLRQKDVPVQLFEAGNYPRHRVCGEFISGGGQEILRELGLPTAFLEDHAFEARTAVFYLGAKPGPVRRLPQSALCISRFHLDKTLADKFLDLGGRLEVGHRWRGDFVTEGCVRATGRRVTTGEQGWRWFGLKVHVRQVDLLADLEMHCLPDAYVGIVRVDRDEVNVCGLFRRPAAGTLKSLQPLELLRGAPGTSLHARLEGAAFELTSLSTVAGLSLQPGRGLEQGDCSIGDSLTMIPPVTGNGMSMALESAALASQPLARYSAGQLSWTDAVREIARSCDRRFASRLAWARWLQKMMFWRILQGGPGRWLLQSDLLWHLGFARTRS